jgi:hypothetical protein
LLISIFVEAVPLPELILPVALSTLPNRRLLVTVVVVVYVALVEPLYGNRVTDGVPDTAVNKYFFLMAPL